MYKAPGYFWNLSKLYLEENQLLTIVKHPLADFFDNDKSMNTWGKVRRNIQKGLCAIKILWPTIICLLKSYVSMIICCSSCSNNSKGSDSNMGGKLPVEWFVDTKTWTVRGRLDVSIQIPTKDTSREVLKNSIEGKAPRGS